jgi:DMSO/TMAO reductase YedYZ heme-binding membrane subunit
VEDLSNQEQELPPSRLWKPVTANWFLAIFGIALLYAVIRYHVAGDVSWRHFPLFILDKATSLAAVFFLASSYLIGKTFRWHDHDRALRLVVIKLCGLMGFFLAAVHAFLSLCLLSPAYYGQLVDAGGRLNPRGEAAMAVGFVGLFFVLAPAVTTLPCMPKAIGGWRWKRNQRAGYVALSLVTIHLVILGFGGWLAPGRWHGGLPPISMVAVVAALLPLIVKRTLERHRNVRSGERPTVGSDRRSPGKACRSIDGPAIARSAGASCRLAKEEVAARHGGRIRSAIPDAVRRAFETIDGKLPSTDSERRSLRRRER